MSTDEELIKELEKNIQERTLKTIVDLLEENFKEEIDGRKVWKKKEYREVYDFLGYEPKVTERMGWE